jgi:type I restriction enzyme S subunit
MAAAIFKAWFIDFEPVKAKAAGAKSFPSMPQPVFDAFPSSLVPAPNSPSGEIPKGWRVGVVGEEVEVVGGGTPSTSEPRYWDGTHCWATPKDLSKLDSPILLNSERKITDSGLSGISSGLLPVGSLLLSSRAPIGYLALVRVPTAINQGFIGMRCTKLLSAEFMLHWSQERMDDIKGRANGTTFQEISKGSFRPMPIVVPDETTAKASDSLVKPLYEMVAANVKENGTLAALRDSLLPKLLSGEVRVASVREGIAS